MNVDYKETSIYWNQKLNLEKVGRFASGFVMSAELENIAGYRFQKELKNLNKHGRFAGNYLELGCGTGNLLSLWHDRFDHLIGIDFSKPLVEIARKQCSEFKNVDIVEDNFLNFENYVKDKQFSLIFLGGCFMYLNDDDVSHLFENLFSELENGGILIFREPTASKERIYKENIGIRRTIDEYKDLISRNKNNYSLKIVQNDSVNYTHLIALYLRVLPFLSVRFFENIITEFLFLYLPLKVYSSLKKNMVLYHFFIISKNKS
jgi:SAM-dependent methyltransferase